MKKRSLQSPAVRHESRHAAGASIDPFVWIDEVEAGPDILRAMEHQVRRRRRRRMGATAMACAVVLVCAFTWQTVVRPDRDSVATAAAMVSLPTRQLLPDGSLVELNDGASMAVDFSDSARHVTLRAGEAHFQVAMGERPFVVTAGEIAVRAVGTAFTVQLGTSAIDVLVTAGRVAVEKTATVANTLAGDPEASGGNVIAMVDAGNRLLVEMAAGPASPQPHARPIAPAELKERLAWRVPRLEFSGTPLGEALPMINEHGRVRLVIMDQEIAGIKLSGILRADNIDTLLELLAEENGIRAERREGDEIVLTKARLPEYFSPK